MIWCFWHLGVRRCHVLFVCKRRHLLRVTPDLLPLPPAPPCNIAWAERFNVHVCVCGRASRLKSGGNSRACMYTIWSVLATVVPPTNALSAGDHALPLVLSVLQGRVPIDRLKNLGGDAQGDIVAEIPALFFPSSWNPRSPPSLSCRAKHGLCLPRSQR
ncbi:hypothetical protein VTK26DRAFT_26 [Humicola hyalothermophila]